MVSSVFEQPMNPHVYGDRLRIDADGGAEDVWDLQLKPASMTTPQIANARLLFDTTASDYPRVPAPEHETSADCLRMN